MILKNYLTIVSVFLGLICFSQSNTVCTSSNADIADINSIGKCAIENFKKTSGEEYVKVSTRNRYVRKRNNLYSKLRKKVATTAEESRFTVDNVESIPLFQNCTSVSVLEQKKCFNEQMSMHISGNLKYPEDALRNGVEDKVLATFTINTNGTIKDIHVVSSKKNALLEEEAKRLVSSLPQLIPAKHKGVSKEIRHKVYIDFDIHNQGVDVASGLDSHGDKLINDFVRFDQVTETPVFIDCADFEEDVKHDCFKETIVHSILDNLTYPFDAAAEGIEGRVWVRFIIDDSGYVKNIATTGPSNGILLEKEAERLVSLLPKFLPGKHNNEYVNVEYFIPIDFQLDE